MPSKTRDDRPLHCIVHVDSYARENSYWKEVLRKLVSVVTFLVTRRLALRGSNEVFGSGHNGNYLGCLELLSEYDPFLAQHIEKYGNRGRGNPSYLSSTICEEFVLLMAGGMIVSICVKDSRCYIMINQRITEFG